MKRIIVFSLSLIVAFSIYVNGSQDITVFTIPGCSKCSFVINYLNRNNIKYTEIPASDPEHGKKLWAALKATGKYNGGTVYGPTVIINGTTYFNIDNLESFTASIPGLIQGGNSSGNQNRDLNQSDTSSDAQFIKSITDRHNYYRQNHNVKALKWNAGIQKFAQAWADKIASEDRMYHRQPNSYGENIYWKSGGEVSGSVPVDGWYSEIKSYNYSNPGFSMATGHFTQVVWAGSAEFGCGKARSKRGGTYVVCNYNPPGNYQGIFPANVLPLKSSGSNSGAENAKINNGTTAGKQQTITYSDGAKYYGQTKNGKREGQGTLIYSAGYRYTGWWVNDKRNGHGTMIYTNGHRFTGNFSDNMQNGEGTYMWPNGEMFAGEYRNNKPEGFGVYYYKDGSIKKIGLWQNGNFTSGMTYGNSSSSQIREVITYSDGSKYTGQVQNGKKNGLGALTYTTGNRYAGRWIDDKRNGHGAMLYKNGDRFTGNFVNDQQNGLGTYIWSNGSMFIGSYKDGITNGFGTHYNADGSIRMQGPWENGKFTGK